MSIRSRLAVAAVLTLGVAIAGVMPIPAQAETIPVNRGFGASPHTLDPRINFGAREAWIQDDLYEGLVATAADGKVIPGAAERWDVSDDGKTVTFHLRPNLKWSNGEPLVARDFVNGIAAHAGAQDRLREGLLLLQRQTRSSRCRLGLWRGHDH
ncbi:MAG: ABC transporter substrate-binding protein [Desulfobacterales bacterium]|nr:ABC transporter substrate-binding protein [Desulfobacterales bacterium]